MRISNRKLAAAVAIGLSLASLSCFAVNPPYLLTINDSDPANVTITATGNAAVNAATGPTANNGVDLLNFFGQNEENMLANPSTGTLTGGGLTTAYNYTWSDSYSTGGGAFLDLELYLDLANPHSGDIETFTTSAPAFTGTWTFDLADSGIVPGDLPTPGSTGNILAGDSQGSDGIIGEWEVVPTPEPEMVALLAVGTLISIFFGNRRHLANKR